MDEKLSKGLIRAETREILHGLRDHGHEVFATLMEGIKHRFRNENRLRPEEVRAIAQALHEKAEEAYTSILADFVAPPAPRGRPNAATYDIFHYWIRPIRIPDDPFHQMRLAIFTANGDRKNVEMCAHDTLISFYEHAAHRLLQRLGGREAAIRAIGQRLADTIILPALALETSEAVIDTELYIPFENGLLIGRFEARPDDHLPGRYFRILNRRVREGALTTDSKAEFVVKTFVSEEMLNQRQIWIAHEVAGWLARHQEAALIMRRHLFHPAHPIYTTAHMSRSEFDTIKAGFDKMRAKVFGG